MLRKKPIPSNPNSLPQMYQRWLYEDYAYLWTQQTPAIKQSYATLGSRQHLTGFQCWMKLQLTLLPDINALYHLDFASGALVLDFSRNFLPGTIIGPIPSEGVISSGFFFDHINDRINLGTNEIFNITSQPFSWEFFFRTDNTAWRQCVLGHDVWNTRGYMLEFYNPTQFIFWTFQAAALSSPRHAAYPFVAGTFYHIVVTRMGTVITFYIDGAKYPGDRPFVDPVSDPGNLLLGSRQGGADWMGGYLDHIIYYNRALDDTEALRHSLRRYPL